MFSGQTVQEGLSESFQAQFDLVYILTHIMKLTLFGVLAGLLFHALQFVFRKLQAVVWQFNGTQQKIKNIHQNKSYETCAHVQSIWTRYTVADIFAGNKANFISTHDMFTHPDYLLANNVSLFDVTPEEAVFVETDHTVDIYNSDVAIFVRIAQYNYAKKLITMPLWAFHTFADNLGDPKGKAILLSNTGRCGSTLLTQVFESTEECVCISEPGYLASFCMNPQLFPTGDLAKLVCSAIRVTCKPLSDRHYSTFVIKTASLSLGLVPILVKEMPQVGARNT